MKDHWLVVVVIALLALAALAWWAGGQGHGAAYSTAAPW